MMTLAFRTPEAVELDGSLELVVIPAIPSAMPTIRIILNNLRLPAS